MCPSHAPKEKEEIFGAGRRESKRDVREHIAGGQAVVCNYLGRRPLLLWGFGPLLCIRSIANSAGTVISQESDYSKDLVSAVRGKRVH